MVYVIMENLHNEKLNDILQTINALEISSRIELKTKEIPTDFIMNLYKPYLNENHRWQIWDRKAFGYVSPALIYGDEVKTVLESVTAYYQNFANDGYTIRIDLEPTRIHMHIYDGISIISWLRLNLLINKKEGDYYGMVVGG